METTANRNVTASQAFVFLLCIIVVDWLFRSPCWGPGHSAGLQCQGHALPHPPTGSRLSDKLGHRQWWAEPPCFALVVLFFVLLKRWIWILYPQLRWVAPRLSLCSPGAVIEEVNKHWDWLVHNLLHSLSVFENKEDAASFVKGKVKVWHVPVQSTRRMDFWILPCRFKCGWKPRCLSSLGPHCRGGSESPGRPGRGSDEVQGGAAEVWAALRPPFIREIGDVLLLLLLEGPGASAGLPLPQHQPRGLLLLPAGEGRSVHQSEGSNFQAVRLEAK